MSPDETPAGWVAGRPLGLSSQVSDLAKCSRGTQRASPGQRMGVAGREGAELG